MNTFKTAFLLTALTLLFLGIGRAIGGEQGCSWHCSLPAR